MVKPICWVDLGRPGTADESGSDVLAGSEDKGGLACRRTRPEKPLGAGQAAIHKMSRKCEGEGVICARDGMPLEMYGKVPYIMSHARIAPQTSFRFRTGHEEPNRPARSARPCRFEGNSFGGCGIDRARFGVVLHCPDPSGQRVQNCAAIPPHADGRCRVSRFCPIAPGPS